MTIFFPKNMFSPNPETYAVKNRSVKITIVNIPRVLFFQIAKMKEIKIYIKTVKLLDLTFLFNGL